jgi:hypothetical protein
MAMLNNQRVINFVTFHILEIIIPTDELILFFIKATSWLHYIGGYSHPTQCPLK